MPTNPLKFILKLFKPKSQTKNAENARQKNSDSCGLCALCGEITR
ncbi:Uncharacterised protein [uncultured archaeon]|nr:Uncharacterised protein [uncultured archaeon]